MSSDSEQAYRDWCDAIRRSDRRAFRALFDASYDPLLRYAKVFTRSEEAASDVLQDVYAKVWQIRSTLDPKKSLKAFLYQIVRNQALNEERRKKRHRTEELGPQHESNAFEIPDDYGLDAGSLEERIHLWIDEMPPRRREAFLLSRFEGLSHDEIAQLMGLTSKTVNNHIVLALQHLRKRLEVYRAQSLEI